MYMHGQSKQPNCPIKTVGKTDKTISLGSSSLNLHPKIHTQKQRFAAQDILKLLLPSLWLVSK